MDSQLPPPQYPFFFFSPMQTPPMNFQQQQEEEHVSDKQPLLSSQESNPTPIMPYNPYMPQQVYGYPTFIPPVCLTFIFIISLLFLFYLCFICLYNL